MGYTISPIVAVKNYVPSDDEIVNNAAPKNGTLNQTTYELLKEITIESNVGTSSLFRFKYTLGHGGIHVDVTGAIFRNGVRIGTETTNNTSYPPGAVVTEDIISTNWVIGDKIQLYAKVASGGGTHTTVGEFKICGIGSEFVNTLV